MAERLDRVRDGRLRDELLNSWRFDSLLEAGVIIKDWRLDYNANRPHSAHGELTPPLSSPYSGPQPTKRRHRQKPAASVGCSGAGPAESPTRSSGSANEHLHGSTT